MKTCSVCGVELPRGRQVTCGSACAREHEARKNREYCRRWWARHGREREERRKRTRDAA